LQKSLKNLYETHPQIYSEYAYIWVVITTIIPIKQVEKGKIMGDRCYAKVADYINSMKARKLL